MLAVSQEVPMLPPGLTSTRQLQGQWWVGHTRSRFEKAFARDLLHCGVGYFLPLLKRTRLVHGRKRRVLIPLFPSYVFFCGDQEARITALRTNRICQAIEVTDQQRIIGELDSVERALSGGADLDLVAGLAPGQRGRVTAGPFKGIEGTVIRTDGQTLVVLEISMLGLGASLEIEADLLESVTAQT